MFEDLAEIVGSLAESEALERIWMESLEECKAQLDRITFDDFKKIMKGQPKDGNAQSNSLPNLLSPRKSLSKRRATAIVVPDLQVDSPRRHYAKKRSLSCEQKTILSAAEWTEDPSDSAHSSISVADNELLSPLASNRVLYRKHREMRLAVLEASKQFDQKRSIRHEAAGLTMKRELQHTRALCAVAAARSGRRSRKKAVSDVTGLLIQ